MYTFCFGGFYVGVLLFVFCFAFKEGRTEPRKIEALLKTFGT